MSDGIPDPKYLDPESAKDRQKVHDALYDPLTKKLNRRRFMQFAGIVGAGVAGAGLIGCSSSAASTPTAKAAATAVGGATPAAGAGAAGKSAAYGIIPEILYPQPALTVPPSTGKKLKIGINLQPTITGWQRYQASFILRIEELGEEVVSVWTKEDFGSQIGGVEALMTQGVDVICISGTNGATVDPIVPELTKRGIKALAMEATAKELSIVRCNHQLSCMQGLCFLMESAGTKDINVVAFNATGIENAEMKWVIFQAVAKFWGGINVVAELPAKWPDATKSGLEDTENLLRRLSGKNDVTCIWSPFDLMAVGAAQAVRSAGREKDIFVMSYGGEDDTILSISKNERPWAFNTMDDYWDMGQKAAEMSVTLGRGGTLNKYYFVRSAPCIQANAKKVWDQLQVQNKVTEELLARYGKK